jgi:DNA (cytosine-5)-methyltransferase 1
MAGFHCAAAVEIEPQACETLRFNRPDWSVINLDIREIKGRDFSGVDILAAGVPCPPFSIAGKQLGANDERDLFPEALRIISEAKPPAVMLENVPGFAAAKFAGYRRDLFARLHKLGYSSEWQLLNASDFGVPQLRPRFLLVALRQPYFDRFEWPVPSLTTETVGTTLQDLMAANGWPGAVAWVSRANRIAPTVVGGSKKHGGPDLGPTRAKRQWKELCVDGKGLANEAPDSAFPFDGCPRLTVRMVARIQSFPDTWHFTGKKTAAYRQIGNAFPPLVAASVARSIHAALHGIGYRAQTRDPRLLETKRPCKNANRKVQRRKYSTAS